MSDPLDPIFEAALQGMYGGRRHRGSDGQMHEIDETTRISPRQGRLMVDLIREHGCKKTLEIGLAYGFSTMFILGALADVKGSSHAAIDPYEEILWRGVGLEKVKDVGASERFTWHRENSFIALAKLAQTGEKFDFIYVDADHRLDSIMIDFYGSDLALNIGGVMVFDDLWMPATVAVLAFIDSNMAHYQRLPSPHANLAIYKKLRADERAWWYYKPFSVPQEEGAWPPQNLGKKPT
ncbi:MAG: class I SAM-dependent methyltransferase [Alphaproteobacteria bacterium]|nr:class I SAM-dependent methyltransferase [Alphaproteobacteria bacterium]